MKKSHKIIYWVATVWLALGMASTGIIQLIRQEEEVKSMLHLGYPVYFLTILGTLKLLGVVAILLPKLPLLKEWAYAGFFFTMAGAICSRIAIGDDVTEILPCVLLLVLTIISWYFRPSERKLALPSLIS